VKHHFQGRAKVDATSPQQFYFMTPCDHNDRHHMPFSILGKLFKWRTSGLTGLDYLTLELYDEMDTWYVWLSSGIRKYVHSGAAVSTLYDENKAKGVAMETFYAGETTIANGRFKLKINNNEGERRLYFTLTHVPTGCRQDIYMHGQNNFNYKGSGRYQMHYARFGIPTCYKCATCGMLGDFQHKCYDAKLYGCDGADQNIATARRWKPRSAGWDPQGWKWQKTFVDGDSCPERASGAQEDEDTYCDKAIETTVIAKCQEARDKLTTCCRNIGGEYCDELQADCEIDTCIAATDDASVMDDFIKTEFSDTVIDECEFQGLFGPVPKLLYEFRGDLAETMSGKAAANTLQAVGDAKVENGALVCDGQNDFVYGTSKLGFTFSGHTLEVLVTVDDLSSKGGGTIAIDGNYGSAVQAQYSHNKFDSIVYNEVGNKKWILGSEFFRRTDTSGSDTAESATNQMVHLVAVYDPDTSSAKLYRNGVEEMNYNPNGFLTSSSTADGWRMMFCQRHFNAGLNDFKGKIMFGAVYDYALSAQDADQLYQQAIVRFDTNIIEAVGDELLPGQSLLKGQGLLSVDRRYIAAMKTDGMFVIYDLNDEAVVFEAEMTAGSTATFEDDGNFVIYDDAGKIVWHSGATDDNAANLIMGINGNLLAIGGNEVFWNSKKHETVALPAAASANNENLNMLDWDINPKENVNGWRFNIGIPDYETMETYTLYLCLLLMSLNLICGAYFCCCNKKAKYQYKVVSMMNTAAEDETTDVEMDKEDAQFLA